MGKTELHGLELVSVFESGDETLHLESNASEQFVGLVAGLAGDAKLFLDAFSKLLVSDEELILNTFLDNVFVQKLRQTLGHLSLHELLEGLHGVLGVLELGKRLHFHDLSSTLRALEVLMELFNLGKLLFLKNLEEGKASCSLKKYVHLW